MASLFIVPTFESLPSSSGSCQCLRTSSGPVRQRALFRRRWNPLKSSRLSRLLELIDDEREFSDHIEGLENLWRLSSLVHPREHRRCAKQEGDSAKSHAAETDKQSSEKAEQKLSPEDDRKSDKFSISLELGDAFEPDEISVKLVEKSLRIEGKHEESLDDGHFSSRQFTRSFYLPDDVDVENLSSALSKEGVLTVEAPRLQVKEKESEERNIPIQQTTSPEAVEEKKLDEAEMGDEEKKNPEEKENEMETTENEASQQKESENDRED